MNNYRKEDENVILLQKQYEEIKKDIEKRFFETSKLVEEGDRKIEHFKSIKQEHLPLLRQISPDLKRVRYFISELQNKKGMNYIMSVNMFLDSQIENYSCSGICVSPSHTLQKEKETEEDKEEREEANRLYAFQLLNNVTKRKAVVGQYYDRTNKFIHEQLTPYKEKIYQNCLDLSALYITYRKNLIHQLPDVNSLSRYSFFQNYSLTPEGKQVLTQMAKQLYSKCKNQDFYFEELKTIENFPQIYHDFVSAVFFEERFIHKGKFSFDFNLL
jgi:hypothetical protein